MTTINTNLYNFNCLPSDLKIFSEFSNEYEYTAHGIFRLISAPRCPICGNKMTHNGYNIYVKKHLGEIKIGKYLCSSCNKNVEEDKSSWHALKNGFSDVLSTIYQKLRSHHVSYLGISDIMSSIIPRSKTTIFRDFNRSMEDVDIPKLEKTYIVNYDEQYPKEGRTQKYRLTILDSKTSRPLSDELLDKKDPETIKQYLRRNLDTSKPIFIVTDFYSSYSNILKEVFEHNLIHQYCLMHLNKLIVNDFPKHTTIPEEIIKYKLLNIFYDRGKEIDKLESLEKIANDVYNENDKSWLKEAKKEFSIFRHELELSRRRNKKNLEFHSLENATKNFNDLMKNIKLYKPKIQNRLRMIQKHWMNLTMFYYVPGAPATNNALENYYSTSLKTHRKKQFRTDIGIDNQIKLSKMKRARLFNIKKPTLWDIFEMSMPFKG
jgi:transposase-like protein